MSEVQKYPKRLIEVDLPIRKISEHARREKSIRHGNISTLHIWWARRPLGACRAITCAALWPDPADQNTPPAFVAEALGSLRAFAKAGVADRRTAETLREQWGEWLALSKLPDDATLDAHELRSRLLDFIALYANWDAATLPIFRDAARAVTQAAARAVGVRPGHSAPLVLDPFAGGGAIPLEAYRVGADVVASDLNPIPILLNRALLEWVPKFGSDLVNAFRTWARRLESDAISAMAEYYPDHPDGARPIAYVWAHTIKCEGPGCGVEVPLIRSLWLSKRGNRSAFLELRTGAGSIDVLVRAEGRPATTAGTIKNGSATCPACAFTTSKSRVRAQLCARDGGLDDARLLAVVCTKQDVPGRVYRSPTDQDLEAFAAAKRALDELTRQSSGEAEIAQVPNEPLPQYRIWKNNPIRVHLYGKTTWGHLFNDRQKLAHATVTRLVARYRGELKGPLGEPVHALLGFVLDKMLDSNSIQVWWMASGEKSVGTFTRQALSFTADFAEVPLTTAPSRSISEAAEWVCRVLEHVMLVRNPEASTTALSADAANHPLPDDCVDAVITDPPYYDAVPYATLSDYFYVWLRRAKVIESADQETPKTQECVVDEGVGKDSKYFETKISSALAEARRIVAPTGIAVVVFAHKTTAGWESMLQGLIDGGWTVTATWPIDTERQVKVNTINRAFLGSSIHLVCRPREDATGSVVSEFVGSWREVLSELPIRIDAWIHRLAEEGVVGADAIFACLGPALEIFSRYSRVEKADGSAVALRDFLEHVWAAVARGALRTVFQDADAADFESDARLTAMWLWTQKAPALADSGGEARDKDVEADEEEEGDDRRGQTEGAGYVLEYDAVRKIAQGLGARLDELGHVVEVKGDKARLLAVVERTKDLFGKVERAASAKKTTKKKQMTLFGELDQAAEAQGWGEVGAPKAGTTTLDRVHQAMLLFGAGRGEALKRFIVEEGVGKQPQFWKLAQSLSALYPRGTDEKRWVDGVLARKKGLGF